MFLIYINKLFLFYIYIYIYIYNIIKMNDYNYYNNDSVAVLMDNMFKCKNEIHVVKPLLKLLHDNNAIPRANYKGINDGLQGFDTDLNEENKLYNNLIRNV